MKRGALLKTVAAFGVVTAIPFVAADELSAWPVSAGGQDDSEGKKSATTNPLTPPASGPHSCSFWSFERDRGDRFCGTTGGISES